MRKDESSLQVSRDFKTVLKCKDHLISGEEFEIVDLENGIFKTQPIPENLDQYYESENYISHTDSSHGLKDKIYQIVKTRMLSKKAQWISEFKSSGKVLDYGAGTGDFLKKMESRNFKTVGVEPNSTARNLANKKNLNIYSKLEEVPQEKFDVITLWHVLEHIPDFENILSRLSSILKPDGILIIAVPNYRSYDSYYYNNKWAAWDVPRHLWHFSRSGLTETLKSLNFSLVKERPLIFDSFYVSMLSENNKDSTASMIKGIFRGLLSNLSAKSTGEYSSLTYFFKKD